MDGDLLIPIDNQGMDTVLPMTQFWEMCYLLSALILSQSCLVIDASRHGSLGSNCVDDERSYEDIVSQSVNMDLCIQV